MYGYINDYNFKEMENMRYWAPPSSWSDEKKKKTTNERIYSGKWLGAEKKDGYFAKFVKDSEGTCMLLSRSRAVSGEYPNKISYVPQFLSFFDELPNGTCLLGEIYLPFKPGSRNITTILGCLPAKALDRQEKGEKLHFYVFDCLAFDGVSMLDTPAKCRFDMVEKMKTSNPYVSFAKYYIGEELSFKLQEYLAQGKEGMVIINGAAPYRPGKRPSTETQKVKKELKNTIDCFFTGNYIPPKKEYTGKELPSWKYYINSITNEKLPIDNENTNYYRDYIEGAPIIPVTKSFYLGFAGSLEIAVLKDEVVVPIGYLSGLTEEIKGNPHAYANKCIEVTAMEIDMSGAAPTLRHGKMLQFRPDLSIEDCTLEKITG